MATASRKTTQAPAKRATSAVASKTTPRAARAPKAPVAQEATALLKADHKLVSSLFEQYEKTRSTARKKTLVASICMELGIHAKAEEEIFYPAVKAALKDKELVPEATIEHASMKELMAQVEGKEPDGEMFDAKVKVLSEYVKHHVKEEETEMFPKARKTKLDMKALGAQIAARKDELKASWPLSEDKPGILSRVVEAIS
ncbi:hemerythrin domain-containing protein [Scleromatobacter humisilvae]|uniref:Hemerythrin domain-containing protein n=1 Tax=Scleromatobacter humisilvae TaxID=2897159 RepID=A0A9X1YQA3_9BURK|nr:hemerythrin domain-containing protein [Scleromatobacter humisilvae]MCK9689500.1 hemerythrin domain-containing protein [Scleromatobacter humisilvae]